MNFSAKSHYSVSTLHIGVQDTRVIKNAQTVYVYVAPSPAVEHVFHAVVLARESSEPEIESNKVSEKKSETERKRSERQGRTKERKPGTGLMCAERELEQRQKLINYLFTLR